MTFFLPFGIAGGFPLMLTILLATLAATRRVVFGCWVLALFALIWGTGDGPRILALAVPVVAAALTVWRWLSMRRQAGPTLLRVNSWLEGGVRLILLLLAAFGLWEVAQEIMLSKPGVLGVLYVLLYLLLLYPLFLALRIGLEPRRSAERSYAHLR